ncbi:MAG: hypothetical protein COW51_03010 [Candidatus Moranbacteria bacterium CG17_big_fil_post_rev_8_21_14_2_50_44_12]|nr:MAG: hypothetical protein COW51_03010 [Candidatus Moranbacteria bacterium CG17_big_fil_post_rev_8_21_14_2_50_44_12]
MYKVEKNPKDSEEKETSSETGGEKMKVWFQENLRMIVSIAIVVAIAGGIYSYSKRTQPAVPQKEAVSQEEGEGKISVIGGETAKEEAQKAEEVQPAAGEAAKPEEAVSPQTSQETESSFIETAVRGDSTTKLARRALANYLEKNPDASLTAEHKIYIEDALRRQVTNGRIQIGETREFSKDMISRAIEKSKSLNEKQLKNLEKYSKKVPGLK